MRHNEARKLLVDAWNKTHNAKEVAEYFSVDTSTVCRLAKRMRETGSVETRVSQRGHKPAQSRADIQNIDHLIQAQPNIMIHEISERLQLHVSDEAVRKAALKLGYVYKKKSLHASGQERPRCQRRGKKHMLENDIKSWYFWMRAVLTPIWQDIMPVQKNMSGQ